MCVCVSVCVRTCTCVHVFMTVLPNAGSNAVTAHGQVCEQEPGYLNSVVDELVTCQQALRLSSL